ncbi:MAG: hypothetical protein U5Q03_04740 [Bacteroidota bacterium]|nr:hypothetical protein [Bacteroidota bacterium]
MLPNGFYDSNILCEECDNKILGNLESYSSIVLGEESGNQDLYPTYEKKINQIKSEIFTFRKCKLFKIQTFLLSIIWRASISRQKIFDSVSLGSGT